MAKLRSEAISVDELAVTDLLDVALAPARAGLMVRTLGAVLPGVATTRDQIADFQSHWRSEAERAVTSEGPIFVGLGDSLTQGIGAASPQSSYFAAVAADAVERNGSPLGVVNLSRSGARIADVLDVQLAALRAIGLPVVEGVCTVGSNDLMRSVRIGAIKKQLAHLFDELPSQIMIATVPDARSQLAKLLNRTIRSEAERVGRPIADVGAALTSWKGIMAADAFHPNDAGHQLWAKTFTEAAAQ